MLFTCALISELPSNITTLPFPKQGQNVHGSKVIDSKGVRDRQKDKKTKILRQKDGKLEKLRKSAIKLQFSIKKDIISDKTS